MESDVIKMHTVEDPLLAGTFVIDRKTGNKQCADRSRLGACLQLTGTAEMRGILIVSGAKAVKCFADITGERLGKAEWDSKAGKVQSVNVIERLGEP